MKVYRKEVHTSGKYYLYDVFKIIKDYPLTNIYLISPQNLLFSRMKPKLSTFRETARIF